MHDALMIDYETPVSEIDWSKSHCGLYLCTFEQAKELMPEVLPVLATLNRHPNFWKDKLIDVKVHMLLPRQYPCIPDWHCDFRPRDLSGARLDDDSVKVGTGEKMWLWTSGAPFTEWIVDGKRQFGKAQQWREFTQDDWHRGTAAEEFTWRCFIRVIPAHLAHAAFKDNTGGIRRHSQVYLDANNFSW